MVALLGPGIGEEHPCSAEATRGNALEDVAHICLDHANVAQIAFRDGGEQVTDSRRVHVHRDDRRVGIGLRQCDDCLTRTESHVEHEGSGTRDGAVRRQARERHECLTRRGKGALLPGGTPATTVLRRGREGVHEIPVARGRDGDASPARAIVRLVGLERM